MKLYFAGAGGANGMEHRRKLESFWYKNDAIEAMKTDTDFFLDSGAFTAFTKNVEIKPEDYARFIHDHIDNITIASSLDAIGDADRSYELFKIMKNLGCDVIPVFHCREDYLYLEKYLYEGADYIALGGMVPESKPWLKKWLDTVWENYLVNPDGSAKVKVHGFGMTIFDFMVAYPWYSVDSSSWTYGARFSCGLIKYPNGKYSWTYFGQNHSSRKQLNGKNYWTMDPITQSAVDKFVTSLGYSAEDFTDTAKLNLFNADVFDSWLKFDLGVFQHKQEMGLF